MQQAMVKLYVAWPRLRRQGGEDAYVRRILVNAHLDAWRWRRRRPETSVPDHMHAPAVRPAATEDRDALRRALAALPEGQRRVVVLRYWLDQSVDETAALGYVYRFPTARDRAQFQREAESTIPDDGGPSIALYGADGNCSPTRAWRPGTRRCRRSIER